MANDNHDEKGRFAPAEGDRVSFLEKPGDEKSRVHGRIVSQTHYKGSNVPGVGPLPGSTEHTILRDDGKVDTITEYHHPDDHRTLEPSKKSDAGTKGGEKMEKLKKLMQHKEAKNFSDSEKKHALAAMLRFNSNPSAPGFLRQLNRGY